VLGEEADLGDGTEELQWLCDPLDGTRPFILAVPCSTFMLALTRKGEVLVSVIYEPHFDKLYYAVRGGGAFCNGQPIHVSQQKLRGGSVVMGTSSYAFSNALWAAGGKLEPVPGGGYKAAMIASGRAVATIRPGSDFHDVGPSALLIEEAGGKVTALNGDRLLYDKPIGGVIMSNGVDHELLVDIALCRV
jgi:myo-inositol-1(or 4)-monophosphatase